MKFFFNNSPFKNIDEINNFLHNLLFSLATEFNIKPDLTNLEQSFSVSVEISFKLFASKNSIIDQAIIDKYLQENSSQKQDYKVQITKKTEEFIYNVINNLPLRSLEIGQIQQYIRSLLPSIDNTFNKKIIDHIEQYKFPIGSGSLMSSFFLMVRGLRKNLASFSDVTKTPTNYHDLLLKIHKKLGNNVDTSIDTQSLLSRIDQNTFDTQLLKLLTEEINQSLQRFINEAKSFPFDRFANILINFKNNPRAYIGKNNLIPKMENLPLPQSSISLTEQISKLPIANDFIASSKVFKSFSKTSLKIETIISHFGEKTIIFLTENSGLPNFDLLISTCEDLIKIIENIRSLTTLTLSEKDLLILNLKEEVLFIAIFSNNRQEKVSAMDSLFNFIKTDLLEKKTANKRTISDHIKPFLSKAQDIEETKPILSIAQDIDNNVHDFAALTLKQHHTCEIRIFLNYLINQDPNLYSSFNNNIILLKLSTDFNYTEKFISFNEKPYLQLLFPDQFEIFKYFNKNKEIISQVTNSIPYQKYRSQQSQLIEQSDLLSYNYEIKIGISFLEEKHSGNHPDFQKDISALLMLKYCVDPTFAKECTDFAQQESLSFIEQLKVDAFNNVKMAQSGRPYGYGWLNSLQQSDFIKYRDQYNLEIVNHKKLLLERNQEQSSYYLELSGAISTNNPVLIAKLAEAIWQDEQDQQSVCEYDDVESNSSLENEFYRTNSPILEKNRKNSPVDIKRRSRSFDTTQLETLRKKIAFKLDFNEKAQDNKQSQVSPPPSFEN